MVLNITLFSFTIKLLLRKSVNTKKENKNTQDNFLQCTTTKEQSNLEDVPFHWKRDACLELY